MLDVRLILSGLWIAVVLLYLYGDMLRIFSGDFPKVMNTEKFTKPMWLGIGVLMSIPIIMIVVSLTVDYPVNRPANIIAAGFFFLFNLVGLPTYPSAYDRYLLAVSLVFNALTVWYAWNWV
jgi:hypothetical protein